MFDPTTKPPGVYVQEVPATGPITGTGTSTAAFIGTAARADAQLLTPTPITSWTAYVDEFGQWDNTKTLPNAVRGYFENGGTFAYVVAIAAASDVDAALTALRPLKDVSLVVLPAGVEPKPVAGQNPPDPIDVNLQKKVIAHCEDLGDRVAILDGAPDPEPIKPSGKLRTQRSKIESTSGFAALYWPWIVTANPDPKDDRETLRVAPSGHIAGLIARSDGQRGVHKAPANEQVRGALGLAALLDDTSHAVLNTENINALRLFPGRPPLVWGARTTAPKNSAWTHLNVRRLMSFLEDSIIEGTNWAVFEPNNLALWKRLELTINEFLTRVWQSGALFGATADQAFYIKIDAELNPPDTQKIGLVVGEIGVAPVHPAEFVTFRIGMWDGGAQISET